MESAASIDFEHKSDHIDSLFRRLSRIPKVE